MPRLPPLSHPQQNNRLNLSCPHGESTFMESLNILGIANTGVPEEIEPVGYAAQAENNSMNAPPPKRPRYLDAVCKELIHTPPEPIDPTWQNKLVSSKKAKTKQPLTKKPLKASFKRTGKQKSLETGTDPNASRIRTLVIGPPLGPRALCLPREALRDGDPARSIPTESSEWCQELHN